MKDIIDMVGTVVNEAKHTFMYLRSIWMDKGDITPQICSVTRLDGHKMDVWHVQVATSVVNCRK